MIIAGIDIETTGLKQDEGHRIIEIAAQLWKFESLNDCKCVGQWTKRINPKRPIDPEAQRVHGISFEELSMEPTWEVVAKDLQRLLSHTDILVAHNGEDFDIPFISMEMVRIGMAPPPIQVIDTMKQARWATFNGKLPRLEELCYATGVPYERDKAHAAMYDVDVMMKAFFAALRKGFFTLPGQLKEAA